MMTGNKVLVCLALVGSLGFRADVDTRGFSPREASGGPDDCQPPKALVCHVPPDDPESTRNMCLPPNATNAHLGHGDILGECPTCSPTPEVCGDGIDNDCDGLVDEGCLGNRAWHDADLNGVQDSGELGVPGATFLLRATTGALVAIAVSDSAGIFSFSNIPAGSYYIEVAPPIGFSVTILNAGADATLDSDFDPDTLSTVPFTVASGGSDDDIDCGLITSSAHESFLRR